MSPDAYSPVAEVPKGADVPGALPVAFLLEGGQVAAGVWTQMLQLPRCGWKVTGSQWRPQFPGITHLQAPGHPISHVPRLLKGTLPLNCSSTEPAAAGGGTFPRIFASKCDVAAGSPPHTPRPGARGVARLRRRRLGGGRGEAARLSRRRRG